jgi:hypothetical protein
MPAVLKESRDRAAGFVFAMDPHGDGHSICRRCLIALLLFWIVLEAASGMAQKSVRRVTEPVTRL